MSAVYMIKIKKVAQLSKNNQEQIKELAEKGEDILELLETQRRLEILKVELTKYLGIVVVK